VPDVWDGGVCGGLRGAEVALGFEEAAVPISRLGGSPTARKLGEDGRRAALHHHSGGGKIAGISLRLEIGGPHGTKCAVGILTPPLAGDAGSERQLPPAILAGKRPSLRTLALKVEHWAARPATAAARHHVGGQRPAETPFNAIEGWTAPWGAASQSTAAGGLLVRAGGRARFLGRSWCLAARASRP